MIIVEYPPKKPLIRSQDGREQVYCPGRNRWVVLTPEEWVRQNTWLYLTEVLRYPATLIAIEKKLLVGEMERRFDLLVHDRAGRPFVIVECKEMGVALTSSVLDQALRYNIPVRAPYVFISNGSHCMGFDVSGDQVAVMDSFPAFPE